jgi:CheY-like chemotaxis protein
VRRPLPPSRDRGRPELLSAVRVRRVGGGRMSLRPTPSAGGAHEYLTKPIDIVELLTLVDAALGARAS